MVNEPQRLNSHHRQTLTHIFSEPLSHNIEWHAVLSLLNAIAVVRKTHRGNYIVTIGHESEEFERPHGKDLATEQVEDLRHLLGTTGYRPSPQD